MVKNQLHFGSKLQIILNQKNEAPKIVRSLKIKWGAIKHYVNKFVGFHAYFVAFNESKISHENTLAKTLELCKNCFWFYPLLVDFKICS
jgi:hypothetical protein